MLISQLVEALNKCKAKEGDIEVTCTGAVVPDGFSTGAGPDVFESTVETLKVLRETKGTLDKRVRLYF